MTPALTLVICTRNRARQLQACLASVSAIFTERTWELVLVDNGSTDETHEVLAETQSAFSVPVALLREERPGIARARNCGWQAASAGIIAFTDDDCYPSPDFVDRVCDSFDADPALGFVGGAVVLHDQGDAVLATVRRREPLRIERGMFIAAGTLISANLAFRKPVLEAIGGFDERFGYSNGLAGSDADAVVRAAAAGWRGLYDPKLVVRHHHRRRSTDEVDRARHAYDRGRGAFYVKCLLDRRLRRTYFAGWLRLISQRMGDRRLAGQILREFHGGGIYLLMRLRGR